MRKAREAAYDNLLRETRTLVIITHARSFDVQDAIDIIKKNGLVSDEVKRYMEENKLHMDIIPI